MSKYTITFLKAPWPFGTRVGDVIELAHVPAWALGKCVPAADDAEVTVAFEAAVVEAVADVPPSDVGDADVGREAQPDPGAEVATTPRAPKKGK